MQSPKKLPPMWEKWDEESKKYDANKEKKEVSYIKTDLSKWKYKDNVVVCGNVGWQGPQIDLLIQELQKLENLS